MSRIHQQRLTPKIGTSSYRGNDGDWRGRAACLDYDPEIWWPIGHVTADDREQIRDAVTICNTCPVRDTCLDEALNKREPDGVWGGRLFSAGKPLRIADHAKPVARTTCGTINGYNSHYRHGEYACPPCREASRDGKRATRAAEEEQSEGAGLTEIAHLADQGVDLHRIATTLGVKPDSVITRLRRNGRHDLIERLRNAA